MSQNGPGGGTGENIVTPFRDIHADSAQRRIADDLHQTRLARGLEIADIARQLRIRAVYLAALEEGRFSDLPGPTYVAGFLRAYGRFLDLDGDELVRRYKDESGGVLVHQQLNFPIPASEARHPTGFMIAAALIVALAVAGVWYVVQERDVDLIERVPEVPEEIVEAAEEALAATTGQDLMATEAEKALPEESADDGLAVDIASPEAGEDTAAVDASVLPGAAEEGAELQAGQGAESDATQEAEGDQALPAAEDAIAATAEVVAEEVAGADAGAQTTGDDGDMAASEAEVMAQNGYVPRVYGRTNIDSRVEVRALEETWIQVEGPGNEILLTRVLLPGDIYRVPARGDVTLDTGNAGGLEIRVDGDLIAPLGEPGIVIRNVSLAPDDLLSR